MSRRTFTIALALAACAPEDAAPVDACPLDAPVRLISPPEGRKPQGASKLSFSIFGDYILYTFDPSDHPAPTYWLLHRCGGEPERFLPATPDIKYFRYVTTDRGAVLYGLSQSLKYFVLDRLDVPGFDEPAPLLGLPDEALSASATEHGLALSTRLSPPDVHHLRPAAAIGAQAESHYIHHGDPAAPAVKLGDEVVQRVDFGDRMLVHTDDGDLHAVDPRTGQSELVLTGVRHFGLAPGARRLIWQQLGDDLVEPIFLRDLDAGVDVQIAVNDFNEASWNRPKVDETVNTGAWLFTGDGAHAALFGPWHAPAAVVRLDTGAPVTPPAGVRLRRALDHEYDLLVDDPYEYIRALWDPRTGALREWFRGPLDRPEPWLLALTDDHLDYYLEDDETFLASGTVWRLDLATGEATLHIPRAYGTVPLGDGRYLTSWATSLSPLTWDLAVFDPATKKYTNIAETFNQAPYFPDQGVLYIDKNDPMSLWAAPIPEK